MTQGIREEIDRLLQKAHSIMMKVENITATESEKKQAKEACQRLYNQIKLLDEKTYIMVTARTTEHD